MGSWRLRRYALSISVAAGLLAGCGTTQPPIAAPDAMPQRLARGTPQWQAQHLAGTACPQVIGKPTCLALQVLKGGITPLCAPMSSCGWTPEQLEAAYGLTGSIGDGGGTNIAVIDLGDLANAASDFAKYRSQFKLGSGGRLTKYNQRGEESNYPRSCEDYGWCLETDVDIEMVAAACRKCNVFLMESKNGIANFLQTEAEAVKLGATIVSNSWICYYSYDCGDPDLSTYFDTPGITYLAGSGDAGYDELGAPSALATVIAVGGTQLAVHDSKYSETIWSDAGGGCADPNEMGGMGIRKPSWQKDADCKYRTDADVAAEAGCSPGVAVYASTYGGWAEACGTSASGPFTAGVIALAGNSAQLDAGKTFWMFPSTNHKEYFRHATGGSDGVCGKYLCGDGRYDKYYSGPSGWGSPNGIKAY
jgi:subtilase family serine protease